MKKYIIKVVLFILLLGTFFVIFRFSNQTGDESGGISKKITNIITKNIESIQNLEENQKKDILNKIEYIIRKIAHFTIYVVVGVLIMSLLTISKCKEKNKISISLIIGIIYASLDEIHQAFIPGRTARITDVIIDSLGLTFGILIILLIMKCTKNRKKLDQCE